MAVLGAVALTACGGDGDSAEATRSATVPTMPAAADFIPQAEAAVRAELTEDGAPLWEDATYSGRVYRDGVVCVEVKVSDASAQALGWTTEKLRYQYRMVSVEGPVVGVALEGRCPNPSVDEAAADAAAEREKTAERARARAIRFNRSQVRITVVSKQSLGGQVEAYFVARGPLARHVDQAVSCMESYLTEYASAYCWAFPSQGALSRAEVDRNKGGLKRLCWSATAGTALAGNVNVDENDQAIRDFEGCPR